MHLLEAAKQNKNGEEHFVPRFFVLRAEDKLLQPRCDILPAFNQRVNRKHINLGESKTKNQNL